MPEQRLPQGKLPSTLFAWVTPAMMINDDDIFNHLGLDALIYLRFLRLLLKAAIFTLPYGIFILIPLNVNGGMKLKEGLDKISMSNVKLESPKLWAHLLAVLIYSLVFLYIMKKEWEVFVLYRQIYLTKRRAKGHVVLVQDIPKENQEDMKFENFAASLFPNQVYSSYLVKNLKRWKNLIEKHNNLVRKRDHIQAVEMRNLDSETQLVSPLRSKIGIIDQKLQVVQELLHEEKDAPHSPVPSGFVVFKTPASQAVAAQVIWDFQAGSYKISPAPDAFEVLWENLALPAWNRSIRRFLAYLMVAGLIILWAVPVTFIASLTNLQTLAKKLKFLDSFATDLSMVTQALLQGLVPVVLTAIFNLLLPYILERIGRFSGIVSKSGTNLFVFSYLTLFLICNTFFFFMLAGSFFSKIQQIMEAPHRITDELAISLPRQANFYLCYVSLMAFVGTGYELTRIPTLIMVQLYLKCWAKSSRERLEAWKPGDPPYANLFANDVLIFLIAITYSVISPVIIPAVIVYFGYRYIVWVNQLLHVYMQEIDLGGRLWPRVSSSVGIGVLVFQLMMIGVFTFKQAYWIVACASPLPFITVASWSFIHKRYEKVSKYLSVSEGRTVRGANPQFLQTVSDSYVRDRTCPGLFELSKPQRLEYAEDDPEYMPIENENANGL
ncbi:uncharacterized protein LOC135685912 isoform X2 [Rhopilema esculentum]|uniref:uncharacterized protein LOC135685912 isoform X2 n=1 Tax=Rhopilema esculentum TaxID=499914 RepID=UPI0031CF0A57